MTDINIYQRLHATMKQVKYVQKERNKGMQYSTVSHDAVTAKVRPALVENGIVYHPVNLQHWQNGNRTEVVLSLRFVNIDKPEEYVDVPGLGFGVDNQDKGPGKAISYAVKYCLLKALGLETGDDADNEEVEHKPENEGTNHRFKPGEKEKIYADVRECLDRGDEHGLQEIFSEFTDVDEKMKVWGLFNSSERASIKSLLEEVK